MKWFKHMRIGVKLFWGFLTMILLTALIGYFAYNSARGIHHGLEDVFVTRLPSIDFLLETDRDLQQLLVAERSMIFTDAGSDTFKSLVDDYETNLKQAQERWNKFKELIDDPKARALFPKYEAARQDWLAVSRKIVDGRIADTRAGRRLALDLSMGEAAQKFEAMRDYIDQLTEINMEAAQADYKAAGDIYNKTLVILLSVTGFALLAGLLIMWAINLSINKPIARIISGLRQGSDQLASSSSQVSSASQQLAEGTSEQAASIEETSASLEEMASMTQQNAENASQADLLMREANQVVEKANSSMSELTASMSEISKASEETSNIIKTIDEIAFQTNLLALNAAVEAARAGEAGAGFAVVADEVRNLALRAADAAKNTAGLIEGTVKKTKDGSELVDRTNQAFSEVATTSIKVGELIAEIAAASKEQTQGIGQVNTAISDMDKVVQQNAANAEESASASEEMSGQAEYLRSVVEELVTLSQGMQANGTGVPSQKAVSDQRSRSAVSGKPKALKSASPKMAAVSQNGEVSPEKVIPFDENFEDF